MLIRQFILMILTGVTFTHSVQFCLVVYIPSCIHANFLSALIETKSLVSSLQPYYRLCLKVKGPQFIWASLKHSTTYL